MEETGSKKCRHIVHCFAGLRNTLIASGTYAWWLQSTYWIHNLNFKAWRFSLWGTNLVTMVAGWWPLCSLSSNSLNLQTRAPRAEMYSVSGSCLPHSSCLLHQELFTSCSYSHFNRHSPLSSTALALPSSIALTSVAVYLCVTGGNCTAPIAQHLYCPVHSSQVHG